jgi:hypothetical protein
MKHVYALTIVGLAFIASSIPQSTSAQCTCSSGLPATGVSQSVTVAPSVASSVVFNFQKFDPSIGTLSCVTVRDTITGVSTSGAINTGPDSTIFKFLLSMTYDISGPGIDITEDFNTTYGPDTLAPYGDPADTVTYGPTNIIPTAHGVDKTGGNAAYIGFGTVSLVYNINGGMITTKGGPNYRSKVTTVFGGTLNLTYFWCPTIPLGTLISNFSAYKTDNHIMLQWIASNDQTNVSYEIQYSKNGNDYVAIGNVPSNIATAGTATQYQYQYNPSSSDVGEIYFRIKRTDASGNSTYSMIKVVNLGIAQRIGIQTYPNPVVRTVMVQFDESQNGNFILELVNTTGQVIQQKSVVLSGSNLTKFDLDARPIKGLYFLRAKNINNNKQYVTKLMIQ